MSLQDKNHAEKFSKALSIFIDRESRLPFRHEWLATMERLTPLLDPKGSSRESLSQATEFGKKMVGVIDTYNQKTALEFGLGDLVSGEKTASRKFFTFGSYYGLMRTLVDKASIAATATNDFLNKRFMSSQEVALKASSEADLAWVQMRCLGLLSRNGETTIQ